MKPARVQVWFLDSGLMGALPASLLELLDEAETLRMREYRLGEDRKRFLLGRVLIRKALSAMTGQNPQRWNISAGAGTKPQLMGAHRWPQLDFNLSHAGNAVVVGVSLDCQVGIDIEPLDQKIRSIAGDPEVFLSLFTESERRSLAGLTPRELWQETLRLWTAKEAQAKLLGAGPNYDFAHPKIASHLEKHELALQDGIYHLAVAVDPPRGRTVQVSITRLTQKDLEAENTNVEPPSAWLMTC